MKLINEKLLNYALQSLREGISVFPVGKDKKPLVSWKQFQTRYASEDEVRGWFNAFEDPQIGFATGKLSNLLVVDVEKEGDPSFLPQETTIVGTGGGGYHYYFLHEEGIRNQARIKPFVDTRGEGGYVVSPFSVSEKGPYTILQKAALIKFPRNLVPPKIDIFEAASSSHSTMLFDKKDLEYYPGYGPGQRNDEMTRYVGYLLTQIHPSDWDSQGWHLAEQANQRNTPPLGLGELQTLFNSIKRTEKTANPLGRSIRQKTVLEEPVIIPTDGSDEIKHIADVADEQQIDQTDIYPLQMPCFDKVILGGVAPGDLVVVAGQSGHGKTSLVQDWTLSLVRGEKKPKSLWFSYEVLPSHLWKKFQEMGMTREDCAFIPCKNTSGSVSWVEAKVKEGKEKFGIKMVMIDHLGFLLPKTKGVLGVKNMSSNYSTFITQVVRDLKSIALQEEVVIFLPVHMRKNEKGNKRSSIDDIKDSSGVAQEADLVFLIEREAAKKDANSYFTDVTKITLAKNRKTGQTVIANFSMINGRFAYDDSKDKKDDEFDNLNKKEVVVVAKEKEIVVKVQTLEIIEKEEEEEEVPKTEGMWDNLDYGDVAEPVDD